MTDHLKPLEELTNKWRVTTDDKEAFDCYQACVVIIKKHYDLSLNETKTAYKDDSQDAINKMQQELESIIDLIVQKVIDPPNAKESKCLVGAFGVELARYQVSIFREAQKKRSNFRQEHDVEDLLKTTSMEDHEEIDIEKEEEEEDSTEDEADDSTSDDDM